jgi:hypothetical protein
VIEVDSEGFMTGIGSETPSQYHMDPCKHPSLSAHTAMRLLRCPEDVMRTHPKLGGSVRQREYTDAMDNGNLIDALLTGAKYVPSAKASYAATGKNGKELAAVEWEAFGDLVIVDTDAWQSNSAKEIRELARGQNKTPILRSDFVSQYGKVPEYLARLELAGVTLEGVQTQVPIYWVEESSTGQRVQCRGLLDIVDTAECPETGEDCGVVITDLKTAADISDKAIARSIFQYNYHVQCAVYQRGYMKATDVIARVRLAFLRTSLPAARADWLCDTWLQFGALLWERAVDIWAECLSTGYWPGHELRTDSIVPEHYMIEDMKRQLGLED